MSKVQIETHHIQSNTAYQIPFYWFCNEKAKVNLVLMAALGVPARFYLPLAETLHKHGVNVLLLEQRGHGKSALRAKRHQNYGFKETLQEDIPLAISWLEKHSPDKPLYLMGHSLGGHYAVMCSALFPNKLSGIILAACGTPWFFAFKGKTRLQLRLLCFLIPLFEKLLGYYPGDKLGFGGREASRLMRDWLALAKHNVYCAIGMDQDFEKAIPQFSGRVLSLRMANDDFAPEAAMNAVSDKLSSATIEKRVLSSHDIGDKADHFRWVKNPECAVEHIISWIDVKDEHE